MFRTPNMRLQSFARDHEPAMRLFCFPYAGSGAHLFSTWARHLPSSVATVGVNYWTGDLPEVPDVRLLAQPATLVGMAKEIATAMLPSLDVPFAMFGHSMGGLVAYEVYWQIEQMTGERPRALFLSGTRAPHNIPTDPLHLLDDDRFRKRLLELDGLPQEIIESPQLLARALHRLKFDFAACEGYRKASYEAIYAPITVFHGRRDKFLTIKDSEEWREHAGNGYSLRLIDGDHFFIHSKQEALLQCIKEEIL